MFAVIVLGIGFIMIAAMFPVMISQSKLTVDETTAAAIARGAMATTARIAEGGDNPTAVITQLLPPTDLCFAPPATPAAVTDATNPAGAPPNSFSFMISAGQQVSIPGKVLSFNDARLDGTAGPNNIRANLWNSIRGNIILPSDTRYAWVPLYRRDRTYFNSNRVGSGAIAFPSGVTAGSGVVAIDAPFATVYFIPVAVRNRSLYNPSAASTDLNVTAPAQLANLEPRPVRMQMLPSALSLTGYVIVIGDNPTLAAQPDATQYTKGNTIGAVSEGSFVIVSDDRIAGPVQNIGGTQRNVNQGRMNGRIYRLGTRRADLDGATIAGNVAIGLVYEAAPGFSFTREAGADNRFYDTANPVPANNDDIYMIGNTVSMKVAFPAIQSNSDTVCNRPADAFVVGREIIGNGIYEGAPQDVAAYVTFVRVN